MDFGFLLDSLFVQFCELVYPLFLSHYILFFFFIDQSSTCHSQVDIGFLLDSSGSIRYDYDTEKDFLLSLTSAFNISANGSLAGVITFSTDPELSIKLNDHTDFASFETAVRAIPLMGKNIRILICFSKNTYSNTNKLFIYGKKSSTRFYRITS